MELNAHEERMVFDFDRFHDATVGGFAAYHKSAFFKRFEIIGIEFVSVAVSFFYHVAIAVCFFDFRAVFECAGVCAKAHRSADFLAFLVGQNVDDVATAFGKFTAGCVFYAKHVASVFDDGDLHAEADSQIRYFVRARVFAGCNHALNASCAEAAGDDDSVNVADTTKEELSKMMVGRDVKFAVDKDDAQPKGEILKVENLCVESKIHKKLAVKDVSFTVHSGEIVCIAGIDGNGQTELVYGLTGLEKLAPNIDETEERKIDVPVWTKLKNVDKKERAKLFFTQSGEFIRYFFVKLGFKIWDWMKKVGEGIASKCVALWNKLVFVFDKNRRESIDVNADVKGRVYLCGQDITKASIRKRSKTGMSHIPEDRHKHGLVLDYSLEQNMVLQRYWEKDFQAGGFIKKKSVRKYSDNLIAQYDVRSGQGSVTKVRSMSGGNQQKAIVARELDRPHNLLVAVQPTRGLDVGAIEYIHAQIVKDRDEGAGVLLVSLELDEVMNLSDRILVMYEGEIVGELDPKKTTVQELGLYMAGAKRDAKEKNNEEN